MREHITVNVWFAAALFSQYMEKECRVERDLFKKLAGWKTGGLWS